MKIRNGFISNSSSSSFIITNKENFIKAIKLIKDCREDYYIYNDVLYTTQIHEDSEFYSVINKIADLTIDGSGSVPYGNDDDYVEVEGSIYGEDIYIPVENLTDKQMIELGSVPRYMASQLYVILRKYFSEDNKLSPEEVLEKCKNILEGEEDED